jgi:hypothetical protein
MIGRCDLGDLRLGLDRDRLCNRCLDGRLFRSRYLRDHDRSRAHGLDEPRWPKCRRGRLGRFDLLGNGSGLLASRNRSFGKHVAAGEGNVPLAGKSLDELPRNNLFDRARSALQFDAMVALQQSQHFLARRAQQLRNLVNPDCGHSVLSIRSRRPSGPAKVSILYPRL